MKPIQLSIPQKIQLIEMCRTLFSDLQKEAYEKSMEYFGSEEEVTCQYGFYITGSDMIQCSYPINRQDDSYHRHLIDRTHWFEFCVTQIPRKLYELNEGDFFKKPLDEYTNLRFDDGLHPVDSLYHDFKIKHRCV